MEVDKLIQRKNDLQVRLREVLEQEIEDFYQETRVRIKSISTPMVPPPVVGIWKLFSVTVELDL